MELGTDQGTAQQVASQLGYGVESVRSWVRHADIVDGVADGVTSDGQDGLRSLFTAEVLNYFALQQLQIPYPSSCGSSSKGQGFNEGGLGKSCRSDQMALEKPSGQNPHKHNMRSTHLIHMSKIQFPNFNQIPKVEIGNKANIYEKP